MRRRDLLSVVLGTTLLAPIAALAQLGGRSHRIGMLWPGIPESKFIEAGFAVFGKRLRELGHAEDKTVVILHRFAEGRLERLPELARELVAANVDVIVAQGIQPAMAARSATNSIPIVMLHAGNPIGSGLVESLARPGGNVTGTTSIAEELGGKQLDIIHELRPDANRIALLLNAANATSMPLLQDVAAAAAKLRVQIAPIEVSHADDFDGAFARIRDARIEALLVLVDSLTYTNRQRIIDFAAARRLPALYTLSVFVRDGGLVSYGPDLDPHYDRAAVFVDKILKGAKPADLPVEQPTKFELVINLKAAAALGLTVPPALLARADEVIE